MPAIKGQIYNDYLTLPSRATAYSMQVTPTIVAGDVKVVKDGGAPANIATLPTVSGTVVTYTLSATETNADSILVLFKDQAGDEWVDVTVKIETEASGGGGLTLAEIEASTVLAKEATLSTLSSTNQSEHDATQSAIAAIPPPLDSTATQAAAAAALVAYDGVVVSDLSGLATATNVTNAQTAIIAEIDAIPTNPLLTNDARLNNLDAAVSTRLASASYTVPIAAGTIADAVRTELTTELGRVDVAISSRLASASYVAPSNSDISAIKAKTDNLTFSQAGIVDANIQYVNDVQVKGTGTELDPWNPV